ncbi:hypothetical protein GS491_26740 [Rhodococcus hoagii]|nr:hypothetical protein [Prescottella equi]NKR80718.1 hypothetical protein [Prescottella equi]NKS99537.1 hypothetical protein [Prescottella equi]
MTFIDQHAWLGRRCLRDACTSARDRDREWNRDSDTVRQTTMTAAKGLLLHVIFLHC